MLSLFLGVAALAADRPLADKARDAFDRTDYVEARVLYGRMVERDPRDAVAQYNLACVLAQLGDLDASGEALLDAVSVGFSRFHEMRRDESLAPMRGHEVYRRIVSHVPEILDARGEAEFGVLVDKTSGAYTSARDAELRLNFASAVDDESFAFARDEIGRVARWTEGHVFELPDDSEMDPWVAVILPTPEDFFKLVRGAMTVGGYYDRDNRRLVSQDVGPTLRHEFFHVLHRRHQARLGQEHPHWVQEGLAALLEDVETTDSGGFEVVPSWRTNAARRLARTTAFPPVEHIASLSPERFVRHRPRANYALSRAFFMYLLDQGALKAWYANYTDGFVDDPTGIDAIERTLGEDMRAVNRAFREWLRELPEVGEQRHPGAASLGVDVTAGTGSGPVVSVRWRDWRDANPTDLRSRDVVKGIDGREVRSIDDLHRVLGSYKPGQTVTVRVSRWSEEIDVRVKLVTNDP